MKYNYVNKDVGQDADQKIAKKQLDTLRKHELQRVPTSLRNNGVE